MYPHSHILARAVVHIYVYATGIMFMIFRWCPWPIYVPPQMAVRSANTTDKKQYLRERFIYRMAHGLVKEGEILKENYYYEYVLIAKKYGWPYIKETYDSTPETVEQKIVVKTNRDLGIKKTLNRIFSQQIRKRTFRIWWGFDAVLSTIFFLAAYSTVQTGEYFWYTAPLSGLGAVLSLQIYFVLFYILFRIIARQFNETPNNP